MLKAEEEVEKLRRLKLILKEYNIVLSEPDLDSIINGTFDFDEFEGKFPLPSEDEQG